MKKLLALLLALVMVLGLFACGKKEETSVPSEGPVPQDTLNVADIQEEDALSHTFTQFGNARIKIVGSEFVKNDDDEDILRIYYEYTNTDDTLCGHYPNTGLEFLSVTQDGSECQKYSFLPWE